MSQVGSSISPHPCNPYHLVPAKCGVRGGELYDDDEHDEQALSLLQLEEDRGKPYHLVPVIPIIPVMNPFHLIE